MISLEDFSQLLKVLYATPLQPEKWNTFLDLLTEQTGSAGAYLLVADRRQGLSIRMQGGLTLDEEVVRKYAEIAPADPYRLEAIRQGQLGVLDMDALVPKETLEATDMHQLLLKPSNLRHPVSMVLSCSLARLEAISLWRTPEQGKLGKDGWRLMELLYPHVHAVLDVRRKLGTIHDQLKSAEAVADASGSPALLVNRAGRLLHANAAAKTLLAEADGLCVLKGRVRTAESSLETPFQLMVKRAASGTDGSVVAASAMILPRANQRAALQVMASPVPEIRGKGAGSVLLVVNDPERPTTLPEEALRELYGLTDAEVEVASGLLTGYTLEEIAALRKVAVGTVRMQLKAVFAKTKTHKQAELVRLLMQMPGVNSMP
jgi:DNA-binding CsgD family transcriptional regulator